MEEKRAGEQIVGLGDEVIHSVFQHHSELVETLRVIEESTDEEAPCGQADVRRRREQMRDSMHPINFSEVSVVRVFWFLQGVTQ